MFHTDIFSDANGYPLGQCDDAPRCSGDDLGLETCGGAAGGVWTDPVVVSDASGELRAETLVCTGCASWLVGLIVESEAV